MQSYKIEEARKAKGWSQADLAKRIGTSQQQIARYESGVSDIKAGVIVKLSEVLGVTISYLLGLDDGYEHHKIQLDYGAERIVECYEGMDDDGRSSLLDQAEYLLARHPKKEGADNQARIA